MELLVAETSMAEQRMHLLVTSAGSTDGTGKGNGKAGQGKGKAGKGKDLGYDVGCKAGKDKAGKGKGQGYDGGCKAGKGKYI